MLTCQELTELVTDYLEGRLPLMQRARFQLHLGMCRHCRAYLRQMKLTVRTLGKLPDEPIPESVRSDLLARFRAMRPAGPAGVVRRRSFVAAVDGWLRSRGWWIAGLVVLGAALIGLVLGGQAGPWLGMWKRCLAVELGTATLPVAALVLAAVASRENLAAATLAAVAACGALGGFGYLQIACPYSRVTAHSLVVDVGGILLAALLGAAASRVPTLSRR